MIPSRAIERIERATGLAVLDLPLRRGLSPRSRLPADRRDASATDRAFRRSEYRPTRVRPPRSRRDRGRAAADRASLSRGRPRDRQRRRRRDRPHPRTRRRRSRHPSRMHRPPSHRSAITANAMAVWDVPETIVDGVAARMLRNPRVTLCYRRQRRLPDWPYNLFCMVHAKSRTEALAIDRRPQCRRRGLLFRSGGAVFDPLLQAAGRAFLRPKLAASGRLN